MQIPSVIATASLMNYIEIHVTKSIHSVINDKATRNLNKCEYNAGIF